jgi:hypothetical protein
MVHQVPRHRVVLPLRYEVPTASETAPQAGWTRDLSENGACVQLPEHLAPGTPLALVVETEAGPICMAGTVVWADSSGPPGSVHGVRFSSSSADRERLCRWLQRHPAPFARVTASLPARCRRLDGVGLSLEGWTSDLASGGCALFLPERLPVGALLDVVLSTPCGDVRTEGVVVWEGDSLAAAGRLVEHGFRFTKLRAQEGRVEEVLEAILATRAAAGSPAEQPDGSPTT